MKTEVPSPDTLRHYIDARPLAPEPPARPSALCPNYFVGNLGEKPWA